MQIPVSWGRPLLLLLGLAVLAGPASAVTIDWVTVGDPGNAADTATNCYSANCGSVGYEYRISKYEVTNTEYVEFLNARAAADPYGLYNSDMSTTVFGGITRSGTSGSYSYTVKPGFENKPVNYVSFFDGLRFANWLSNGEGSADTETGSYTLLGGTPSPSNWAAISRNPGAVVFLPTENEWYKAAYYDGPSATYFDYPSGWDVQTTCSSPTAIANNANCFAVVGNVTDVGSYTGSASPYGTFDQGGNVWEWNEQMVGAAFRQVRAGAHDDAPFSLAASYSYGIYPYDEFAAVGIRVASVVPEAGTSLLVMTGLAGLAARQERRKRNL